MLPRPDGHPTSSPWSDSSAVGLSSEELLRRDAMRAARWAIGYVVAIAAGAAILAIVADRFLGMNVHPPSETGFFIWLQDIWSTSIGLFGFGLIFALPYTIIGSVAVRVLLPQRFWVFLLVGALCAPASMLLAVWAFTGRLAVGGDQLELVISTIPASLIATYLYGAISFKLGFRRWRSA